VGQTGPRHLRHQAARTSSLRQQGVKTWRLGKHDKGHHDENLNLFSYIMFLDFLYFPNSCADKGSHGANSSGMLLPIRLRSGNTVPTGSAGSTSYAS